MRVAVAQMTSTADPSANLAEVERLATAAAARGARLVVLPEATMRAFGHPLHEIAEPIDGAWGSAVRDLARRLDVTIVVGMFTPADDARVANTLLAASPDGRTATYDKIHLFDAFGFAESATVAPGTRAVTIDVDGTTVGLATCYDLRFPALFTANAAAGATVSIVCASWGSGPGKVDQWRLLARARALDSTTFVVAVGQSDPDATDLGSVAGAPTGVGHSVVASPLGEVLLELGAGPELAIVDLDLSAVDAARTTLPVLANRRFDSTLRE